MSRKNRRPPPPAPLDIKSLVAVKPVGTCPSKKMRYPSPEDAQRALDLARRKREKDGSMYAEQRFYGGPDDPCFYKCGGYHLTSRAQRKDARP
jgi:hypothetical protein